MDKGPQVNPSYVGARVRITATRYGIHAHMVGETGTIARAIMSRNVYRIRLDSGRHDWEAMPENVEILR